MKNVLCRKTLHYLALVCQEEYLRKNGPSGLDGKGTCPACERHGFESHMGPIFLSYN